MRADRDDRDVGVRAERGGDLGPQGAEPLARSDERGQDAARHAEGGDELVVPASARDVEQAGRRCVRLLGDAASPVSQ